MSFEAKILTGGSPCECLPISHETRLKNAIRLVYSYSAVGGGLHIVLDDGNVEDHHIQWCIEEAIPDYPWVDEIGQRACIECARLLLKTPLTDRERIVNEYGRTWW